MPTGSSAGGYLMPPKTEWNTTHHGRLVATYDYTDETGTLLYQVCRFAPKAFQRRPAPGR